MSDKEDDDISDNLSTFIFLPTEVDDFKSVFLHGEIENSGNTVNIYVTGTCEKFCQHCLGLYSSQDCDTSLPSKLLTNWIHLRRNDGNFTVNRFLINGITHKFINMGVVVIYYHHKIIIESEYPSSTQSKMKSEITTRDHFGILREKLIQHRVKKKKKFVNSYKFFNLLKSLILLFSMISKNTFKIIKFSSLAKHVDNYLMGLAWITESQHVTDKDLIKKFNFLLGVVLDILLGAMSLIVLNHHFSMDYFPNFLFIIEKVAYLLKDLIIWLTGNPAGFKLNFIFSKLLATFFLFYIDIWCTFLALLRPFYEPIMLLIFLIGKAGITFQVSMIEDIFNLLTFHINCIYLFAARLYNIQIYGLLALWRLFLGRKKNPMRGRVDSCKYTPEQLFIGTLGFTILLFLLPTTLIFYIVFTFFRIILISFKRSLRQIRYIVQSLQLYSLMLWLTQSPKVSPGIKLIQCKSLVSKRCLVFRVKPVCSSLRETLAKGKPDVLDKMEDFKPIEFLHSLMTGRVHQC